MANLSEYYTLKKIEEELKALLGLEERMHDVEAGGVVYYVGSEKVRSRLIEVQGEIGTISATLESGQVHGHNRGATTIKEDGSHLDFQPI